MEIYGLIYSESSLEAKLGNYIKKIIKRKHAFDYSYIIPEAADKLFLPKRCSFFPGATLF